MEQNSTTPAYSWEHIYTTHKLSLNWAGKSLSLSENGQTSKVVHIAWNIGTGYAPPYYIAQLEDGRKVRFNFSSPIPFFLLKALLLAVAIPIVGIALGSPSLALFAVLILVGMRDVPLRMYLARQKEANQQNNHTNFKKQLLDAGLMPQEIIDTKFISQLKYAKVFARLFLAFVWVFLADIVFLFLLRLTVFTAKGTLSDTDTVKLLATSLIGGLVIASVIGYFNDKKFVEQSLQELGVSDTQNQLIKNTKNFFSLDADKLKKIASPNVYAVVSSALTAQLLWVALYILGKVANA